MLIHHLIISFRNLGKYKSQTVMSVLGLTTACFVFATCCYLIFLILSKNTGFPDHARMYEIKTRNYQPIWGDMKQTLSGISGIEKFTAFNSRRKYMGHLRTEGNENERPVQLSLLEADTSFWRFFSPKVLTGNEKTIMNSPNSIALYESKAKKIGVLFSLPGCIVLIDNVTFTITGILKDPPTNSSLHSDGLIFNQENGYFQKIKDTWNPMLETTVWVMLEKGITPAVFQKALSNYPFVFNASSDSANKYQVYITSISENSKSFLFMLTVLFVLGLLVLLVALFNIISFQSAQFYLHL